VLHRAIEKAFLPICQNAGKMARTLLPFFGDDEPGKKSREFHFMLVF
jgi:hypothetical protein